MATPAAPPILELRLLYSDGESGDLASTPDRLNCRHRIILAIADSDNPLAVPPLRRPGRQNHLPDPQVCYTQTLCVTNRFLVTQHQQRDQHHSRSPSFPGLAGTAVPKSRFGPVHMGWVPGNVGLRCID